MPFLPPTLPRCIRRRSKKGPGGSKSGRCEKCEKGSCDLNHGSDDEDDDVWLSGPKRKRAALQRWYWELEKLRNKSEQEKNSAESGTAILPAEEDGTREESCVVRKAKKKSASAVEGQWQGGMPKIVNVASTILAIPHAAKKPKRGGTTPSASYVTTPSAVGDKWVTTARFAHESSGVSLVGKVGSTACMRVTGDGVGGRSRALIKVLKKINEEGTLTGIGAISPLGKIGEAMASAGNVGLTNKNAKDGSVGLVPGTVGNKTEPVIGCGMVPMTGGAVIPGANVSSQRVVMVMKRTKGTSSGNAEYKVACGHSKELVNVSLEFVPKSQEGTENVGKSVTKTVDRLVGTIELPTASSHVGGNVGLKDKIAIGSSNACVKDKLAGYLKGKPQAHNTKEYGFTLKRINPVTPIHFDSYDVPSSISPEIRIEGNTYSGEKRCGKVDNRRWFSVLKDQRVHHTKVLSKEDVSNATGRDISTKEVKTMTAASKEVVERTLRNFQDDVTVSNSSSGARSMLLKPTMGKTVNKSLYHDKTVTTTSSNGAHNSQITAATRKESAVEKLSDSNLVNSERISIKLEECEPNAGNGRVAGVQDAKTPPATSLNGGNSAVTSDGPEEVLKVKKIIISSAASYGGKPVMLEKRKRGRPRKSEKQQSMQLTPVVATGGGERVSEVTEGVSTPVRGEGSASEAGKQKRGRPRGSRVNKGDPNELINEEGKAKRSLDRQIDVFAGKLVYRSIRGRLVQQAKDTAPVYVEASGRILKDAPRRRRKKPPELDAKGQQAKGPPDDLSTLSEAKRWDTDSSEDFWEKEWDKLRKEEPICPFVASDGLSKTVLDARLVPKHGGVPYRKGSVSARKDGDVVSVSTESVDENFGLILPDSIKKEAEDNSANVEGSTASDGGTEGLAKVLLENGVNADNVESVGSLPDDEKTGKRCCGSTTIAGADERCGVVVGRGAFKAEKDSIPSEVRSGAGVSLAKVGSFSARSLGDEHVESHSSSVSAKATDTDKRTVVRLKSNKAKREIDLPTEDHRASADLSKAHVSSSISLPDEEKGEGSSKGEMGLPSKYHDRAAASILEVRTFCVSSFQGDNLQEQQSSSASTTVTDIDEESIVGVGTNSCETEGDLPSEGHNRTVKCSGEGLKTCEEVEGGELLNLSLPPQDDDGTSTTVKSLMTRNEADLQGKASEKSDGKDAVKVP